MLHLAVVINDTKFIEFLVKYLKSYQGLSKMYKKLKLYFNNVVVTQTVTQRSSLKKMFLKMLKTPVKTPVLEFLFW